MLYGNIAPEGAVVKTAGVPEELWTFSGPAKVFESQEDAVDGILGGRVVAGDVVVIRYEGPRGGPGSRRCCTRLVSSRARGSGRAARWSPTGRFSGGYLRAVHRAHLPRGGQRRRARAGARGDTVVIDIPSGNCGSMCRP